MIYLRHLICNTEVTQRRFYRQFFPGVSISLVSRRLASTTFVIVEANAGELQMIRAARAAVPGKSDGGKDK